MNIILLEPEIPANTGNIGRTCVATNTALHLIKPLGFDINEKALKRAGLDYWDKLDVKIYEDFEDFLQQNPDAKIYMATTKAKHTYADVKYEENSFIMFGKESAGIPENILYNNEETCIRIPMANSIRSLNLSNSVSVILYEALRQQEFKQLQLEGQLTKYTW
jgi:tRNA (cytidine/uridine-2'-O-)-methyltransferase